MIRTPIYTDVTSTDDRTRMTKAVADDSSNTREPTRDDVLTKIVKYVPGEVVAAFAAIFALGASVGNWALWVSLILGLIATPSYFWIGARTLAKQNQPRSYFYLLSIPAFAIWSLAISSQVRDLLSIDTALSEWLLFAGAFSIPFLDEALTATWPTVTKRFPFIH